MNWKLFCNNPGEKKLKSHVLNKCCLEYCSCVKWHWHATTESCSLSLSLARSLARSLVLFVSLARSSSLSLFLCLYGPITFSRSSPSLSVPGPLSLSLTLSLTLTHSSLKPHFPALFVFFSITHYFKPVTTKAGKVHNELSELLLLDKTNRVVFLDLSFVFCCSLVSLNNLYLRENVFKVRALMKRICQWNRYSWFIIWKQYILLQPSQTN